MSRPRFTQAECDHVRRLVAERGIYGAAAHYGCSYSAVAGIQRRGFRAADQAKRALPSDWAQVAPGKSADWLQKHYRCGRLAITRWLATHPVETRGPGGTAKPIPEAYPVGGGGRPVVSLSAEYGVSRDLIRKWNEVTMEHEARRIAALTPFERMQEKVAAGAKLIAKPVLRQADHAFSLMGGSLA
jgi:hypothetical protein